MLASHPSATFWPYI